MVRIKKGIGLSKTASTTCPTASPISAMVSRVSTTTSFIEEGISSITTLKEVT